MSSITVYVCDFKMTLARNDVSVVGDARQSVSSLIVTLRCSEFL